MNWFKTSQIWNTEYDNSGENISEAILSLYNITYKYQMMMTRDFKGYPRRKENILLQLESKGREIISYISGILGDVFNKWLGDHRIDNPMIWAKNRLNDIYGSNLQDIYETYLAGYGQGQNLKYLKEYLTKNIEKATNLNNFLKQFNEDLSNLHEEENDSNSDNQKVYNYSFTEIIEEYYGDNLFLLLEKLEELGYDTDDVVHEIVAYGIFEIWYSYWKKDGIDDTVKRIKDATQIINQIPSMSMSDALYHVNYVINLSHQTGSMLEHISEHTGEYLGAIEDMMDKMSSNENDYIEQWDKELEEVGARKSASSVWFYDRKTQKMKNVETVYLRFGDLPKGDNNELVPSMNGYRGNREKGLSVYEAYFDQVTGMYILSGGSEVYLTTQGSILNRPVYLVEGIEIGTGRDDGEPLLDINTVKVIKRVDNRNIVTDSDTYMNILGDELDRVPEIR